MSTTGRTDAETPDASDIATQLREAGFVRLAGDANGDAVAATSLLARVFEAAGIPYQASLTPMVTYREHGTDAGYTLALGRPVADAETVCGTGADPASVFAHDVASALGSPDVTLAIAGCIAAGAPVPEGLLETAAAGGLTHQPGVAIPTTDGVDGLTHSTLVHGQFSGRTERAEGLLEAIGLAGDEDCATRQRLATRVALAVANDENLAPQAAKSVQRFLRPLVGGPFETVGGFADVLDATARRDPGLALELGIQGTGVTDALECWRQHGQAVHRHLHSVRESAAVASGESHQSSTETSRFDGLYVIECSVSDGDSGPVVAPFGTVSRMVLDWFSPEPVVVVVADDVAVATARPLERFADSDEVEGYSGDLGAAFETAVSAVGASGGATQYRGQARIDGDTDAFIDALREAL